MRANSLRKSNSWEADKGYKLQTLYFVPEVHARACRDCNFPDFQKNITMKVVI